MPPVKSLLVCFATAAIMAVGIYTDVAKAAWTYEDSKDGMEDAPLHAATATSENEVELALPYNGGTRARLILFRQETGSTSVFLNLDRGQFSCITGTHEVCFIHVKFDSEPVEFIHLSLSRRDRTKSSFSFYNPPKKDRIKGDLTGQYAFIEKLKSHKTLVIEPVLYPESLERFTFDLSNLKWNDPAQD